ncbi:M56 family metallopeptidase [Candidatus Colwellia aromaticivorans]|uniref:M56 family metallopeptidase n=1 Tax=Candidatus Colwellia aromaticivorans TaxID=2267621 RepID=UPI000DF3DB8A|nr:M56 family metallopeptidase [Candidatus Colwellia aromaticivorans]
MLTLLSTSPFLTSLSLTLLHFMWQGLLVAAVLKSALLILNNHKPQLRYALSTLAMSANLLLPIITFVIIYQTESSAASTLANSLALSDFIQELKQPNAFFSYNELTVLLPSLLPYVAIFWLATIFLLAGKLLFEMCHVNNLPQQNTVAPSDKLQARFNELANQIHLTITPRLLISLKIEVPMAIGWLKPVVLLPASMVSGLSTPQLEMLLLHELAHIRRHDYLVNFFQTLVEILLFFHPAVHWVSKQMRNEREYCSDDIAVQHCGDAVAYAHTLADTASLCTKAHHHTIPNMAMAASGGDLKKRVIRLVDHHCAPKNNISKWFASLTIVFSVLLLSSKQLLTMPLLDIWYNEKPSQHSDNTTNAQKNITDTDNVIPNSSIAQQLLIPYQASKSNIARTTGLTIPFQSQDTLTRQQQENSQTLTTTVIEEQLIIATQQQALTSSKTSRVKQALERSDSNSKLSLIPTPYPQEIETLAISPLTKTANTEQIKTIKGPNSVQISDSSSVNSKKNDLPHTNNKTNISTIFVDHISRQKEEWVQPILIVNKSIVPISPVWRSAEQVKKVVPIYPSVAKRKGIELDVKVDFTIDVDGQIKNIKFAQHNKINYFKKSIRTAIEKWRFLPAKVDEKPVESQMAKVFSFSLQS